MFIEDFSVILGIYMLTIIDLSGMFYDSLELAIIYSELKYLKNKDSVKVVFFVDFKIGRIFDFDFFRAIFRDFKFSFFLNINRFSIYIVNLQVFNIDNLEVVIRDIVSLQYERRKVRFIGLVRFLL